MTGSVERKRAGAELAKRMFDISASAAGLVILSPLLLLVALAVAVTSRGGIFFVHPRVGRFERTFPCYKFRTMAAHAPVAGSHEVSSQWITPVGKFLRRRKIDELPQLYNVLRGEMSLVGPRPCLPSQDEVIAARRKRDVFTVRPGIAGPAQLASIDMSTPEKLAEADAAYIARRDFLGDLRIIAATIRGRGAGDAVFRDEAQKNSSRRK
jgi:O-antigen biosynthesis protein WbqP